MRVLSEARYRHDDEWWRTVWIVCILVGACWLAIFGAVVLVTDLFGLL